MRNNHSLRDSAQPVVERAVANRGLEADLCMALELTDELDHFLPPATDRVGPERLAVLVEHARDCHSLVNV